MTATISASLVKELRERTGAGMMECKRALVESNGNIDTAIDAMRKSGLAKADKKADRIAAEGIVIIRISDDKKHGIIIEINCETDFVARDSNFVAFANTVAEFALKNRASTVEKVSTLKNEAGETIDELRKALVTKVGENIQIRRVTLVETSRTLALYIHNARIGALVDIEGGDETIGKDIAMHIVANNPLVIKPDQVPHDLINKEKEIFAAQAKESGKPANIIDKMIEGRVKKFLDEISLVGQPFIRDADQPVGNVLKTANATVHHFVRYAVGEGIEKKTEDFAESVMAQVRGA